MDNHILSIDLSTGLWKERKIDALMRKRFIGGQGLNTHLLLESKAIHHDAFDPENVLIFGLGPLVGTGMMAGNRCTVTAKSPITDHYGDSNVGGSFPVYLKRLGIDHLVIEGKSDALVYLLLKENGAHEIHAAPMLKQKDVYETARRLKEIHGEDIIIASIGQSGENLVRYSTIMMEEIHAAGRMGMGAVMGSKNLKAIVVEKTTKKTKSAHPERFAALKEKWLEFSRKSPISKMGQEYGTLFLIELYSKTHALPVKNFQMGSDARVQNLYAPVLNERYKTKTKACYACPLGCSKEYGVKEGKYKGLQGERIEYGAASIGPMTGVFTWPETLHLKLLCDQYGLDTIELGGVLGFIYEAFQRGKVTAEQIGKDSVQFGCVEDSEYFIDRIVHNEGIGAILGQGVYRAAKALGLPEYAFTIHKSSTGLQSNKKLVRSLGYITSTRGGDHLKSFAFSMQNGGYQLADYLFGIKDAQNKIDQPDYIGRVLWWHENYKIIVDSIGVCLFAIQGLPFTGSGYFDDFAEIMNSVYDLDMTELDVFESAERIYQLQNAFNIENGLTLDDYQWPTRKKEKEIDQRLIDNTTIMTRDEKGMLPEYFKYRGLNDKGQPTRQRFEELNITDVCEEIQLFDDENPSFDELLKTVKLTVSFDEEDYREMEKQRQQIEQMIAMKKEKDKQWIVEENIF